MQFVGKVDNICLLFVTYTWAKIHPGGRAQEEHK